MESQTLTAPVEAPVTPTAPATPAHEPEAPLSIAEHAATYGPGAQSDDVAEDPATPHHAQLQARDKDSQQFRQGRKRPQSAAVARINELTAARKTAEERAAQLEAELARLRSQPQTAPESRPAPATDQPRSPLPPLQARPAQAVNDPEPKEDDPKFEGDYGKFLRAAAAWEAREQHRQIQKQYAEAARARRVEHQQAQTLHSWGQRVEEAMRVYPDFEQVVLKAQTIPIRQGGIIDAYTIEDDAGPKVVYHLLKPENREELASFLAMEREAIQGRTTATPLLRKLALLSQRLSEPASQAGGGTGAPPRHPQVVLAPRPPTPVRTEARSAVEAPPTDGSLSIAEHSKHFGPKRR